MPYKSDKIKLPEKLDRRVKLTTEEKEEIKKQYNTGEYSYMQLALEHNVSKSLIAIIVNPDRAAAVKKRIKEHWKDYAYNKERHCEAIKNTRKYKQELYKNGIIGEEV